MAEEQTDLAGKNKTTVSVHGFYHMPREASGFTKDVNSLHNEIYEQSKYSNWFHVNSSDKTRAVLGKNWDLNYKDPNNIEAGKEFFNDWGNPRLFYDMPIYLEHCGEPIELPGLITKEKIVLQCEVPFDKGGASGASLSNWLYYMKTGAKLQSGQEYQPVVKTWSAFYDHSHDTSLPFTPKEMLNKQPAGKTFFADYKTYYNERTRRAFDTDPDFETATGPNNNIQNSLPSIYGFIKFLLDKNLSDSEFFNLKPVTNYIYAFYQAYNDNKSILHNLYTDLLKKYPLEALTVLYGAFTPPLEEEILGPDNIVEKILSLSFDIFDADALLSEYYDKYAEFITSQERLQLPAETAGYVDIQTNFIKGLERIMTNLSFSPHSIKTLNKVDQYKKYFPFYSEINFTAKLHTEIGDMAKKLYMTKFLSEAVLSDTKPPESSQPYYFDGTNVTTNNEGKIEGAVGSWTSIEDFSPKTVDGWPVGGTADIGATTYVDYYQDIVYKDLKSLEIKFSQGFTKQGLKKTKDFDYLVKNFAEPNIEPYSLNEDASGAYITGHKLANQFSKVDLRNYMTYFNNSISENGGLDQCNIMFKKLFGTAFYAKVLDTYEQHKRSYSDIMNGKKAYTEDLFYRIVKKRKLPSSDSFEVVQNILIPNTSELDIVQYVDTQLKYGTYAKYQYDIYTHRLIFGCFYFYGWLNPQAAEDEVQFLEPFDPLAMTDDPISPVGLNYAPDFNATSTQQKLVDDINELGKGLFITDNGDSTNNPFDGQASGGGQLGGNGNENNPLGGDTYEKIENDLVFADPLASDKINPESIPSGKILSATVGVQVHPDIRMMEDLLFSTPVVSILDRPPVIPDVNIVPYRAINNRLKILLTGASDRYRAVPIHILEQDQENFQQIKDAQLSPDNKVEFGSDDIVSTFEIFRIQTPPQRYEDFELLDRINRQAYEEEILPNTKYYYTFRAIDQHGHISNPTPVYEVELIDEHGAVKPVIRLYDMKKIEPKSNIKSCQKYIYIKPSLKQLYFADDPEVDSIFSDPVKYKKYKIRLTSKGSGKKIDINFKFRKNLGSFELLDTTLIDDVTSMFASGGILEDLVPDITD